MERRELAAILGTRPAEAPARSRAVEDADPRRFMGLFSQAVADGGDVFLADPAWRSSERARLDSFLGPGGSGERGWLMIPSGGAGGGLKFARHDAGTIAAAVRGFQGHFGMERVHSVSVLPLHHVSGFMAWMRSALTGGTFVPIAWKEIEAGRFPSDPVEGSCLSLVPTQLQRLLVSGDAAAWLRRFRVVFLGGGPAWGGLLDQAARLGIPLSACYGATETAAMIAAQRPEEFLGGARDCGTAMPHAGLEVSEAGVLRVSGESLFRGYYPESRQEGSWTTGDLGALDARGRLTILGRRDDVIMTGGKKVVPAEVEEALRSSGQFSDVAVLGLPDPEWGQVIVACHPRGDGEPDRARVERALLGLAAFKHPKRYAALSPWPRNAQGKINRAELARIASGA